MDDAQIDQAAFAKAGELLGAPLTLPLGVGEPPVGEDFRRLATRHTFGDSWSRPGLDVRSRALVSVTIAATLGTREPLRGQLRIALRNGVSTAEIVELFIHVEAYAGAARAFDSYQVALEVFAEDHARRRDGADEHVQAIVTKSSPRSVTETVDRIRSLVEARGMKVFAIIDHSGEAAARGLELRDTKLVVFGSPDSGTPVMGAAPLAALDLPLKLLVWDDRGQTVISYTAPTALAARHGLSDALAARLAGIDALADAVVAVE
jgi:4-carboxymuconolactone decarboxylase